MEQFKCDKMKIIEKINDKSFSWIDKNDFTKSDAFRSEIHISKGDNAVYDMKMLFYNLFSTLKNNFIIDNNSWWDFCLDVWNPSEDRYSYDLKEKSIETQSYLKMLYNCDIDVGYEGLCKCNDWDFFLTIILNCIITHISPYSPLFCDVKNEFFFYFHHTSSIGLYYKHHTPKIEDIFTKSNMFSYDVISNTLD